MTHTLAYKAQKVSIVGTVIAILGLIAAFLIACHSMGCQPACSKALPNISAAQVYTADLSQWISDVRAQVNGLPLTPESAKQLNADLDKLAAIVHGAYDAESAAITACSSPDLTTVLTQVVPLVDDVMQIVALFGATRNQTIALRQPMVAVRMRAVRQ